MRKIIPFKKDLIFKTNICEITSISLEHKITFKSEDMINGHFLINGDYKMTEGNIEREKFEFDLPFDIALGTKIDINNMIIDIDDFYYDISGNKLKVNIDVFIEGEEIEEVVSDKEEEDREIKEEKKVVEEKSDVKEDNERVSDTYMDNGVLEESIIYGKNKVFDLEEEDDNIDSNDLNEEKINIFSNLKGSETYITYHVYIVKEEDNIDMIMSKYNVSKEDLEHYNDLENIKSGDKIIIPYVRNE